MAASSARGPSPSAPRGEPTSTLTLSGEDWRSGRNGDPIFHGQDGGFDVFRWMAPRGVKTVTPVMDDLVITGVKPLKFNWYDAIDAVPQQGRGMGTSGALTYPGRGWAMPIQSAVWSMMGVPERLAIAQYGPGVITYGVQFGSAFSDRPYSIGPTSLSNARSSGPATPSRRLLFPQRPMTLEQREAYEARMRQVGDSHWQADQQWDESQSVMTSDARSHGLMLRSLMTRAEAATHAATAEFLAPFDAMFDPGIQEITGGRTTGMELTDGALVAGSVLAPELLAARRVPISLDPRTIAFSQSWVSRQKYGALLDFDGLVTSMRTNGWRGSAIDVVEMPGGGLTSIDNTRVLAARHAGIDVLANVRMYDEPITDPYRALQLRAGDTVPRTWGEAASLRIGRAEQNILSRNGGIANWSERFPYGSLYDPVVWP